MSKCLKCVHADFKDAQQEAVFTYEDVIFFACTKCEIPDDCGCPLLRERSGTMGYELIGNKSFLDGGATEEECNNFEEADATTQKFVAELVAKARQIQDARVGKQRTASITTKIRVQANDSRCCGLICPFLGKEVSVFGSQFCYLDHEAPVLLKATGNKITADINTDLVPERFRSKACIEHFGG